MTGANLVKQIIVSILTVLSTANYKQAPVSFHSL